MKEGWKYERLGEVASFIRGLTYSKNDEAVFSSKKVLRSNNVTLEDGKLNFEEIKYLKEDFCIPEDKKVKKGSLLMCMSNGSKAHLGKVALIDAEIDYAFGGFMGLVSHNESLDDKFFWYCLIAPNYRKYIEELSAGANINNIKIKDLEKYVIPVPPLPEQQRIVTFLDTEFAKIDALKAKAEQSLQNAKDLFQAALQEMMETKEGWKELFLVEEFKLSSGDNLPAKKQIQGQYPVYGGNGITGYHNDYNLDGCQLLLGRVGALCGNVHLTNSKIWVTDNAFMVNNISDKWDKTFLFHYLSFLNLNQYASQTAQPVISNKSMRDVVVYQPSITEQRIIAETIKALDSRVKQLQSNYTRTLQLCADLKQSLLKQVFE